MTSTAASSAVAAERTGRPPSPIAAMKRRFEKPVLLASALVIPAIIVEATAHAGGLREAAAVLNWVIWAVFVAELAAMLAVAPSRTEWMRANPLLVLIVLVTVPFLPASVQAARAFRLARLVRLVLVIRLARRLLSPSGLQFAAAITGLAVLGGATAFEAAEQGTARAPTLWDSIWWAVDKRERRLSRRRRRRRGRICRCGLYD